MSNNRDNRNAAAMRKALMDIVLLTVKAGKSIPSDVACGIIASKAKHALAVPARNAERFDDYLAAVDAWKANEKCLGRHLDGGTCEKDPLAPTLAPVCFAHWLFAPAEGGAE